MTALFPLTRQPEPAAVSDLTSYEKDAEAAISRGFPLLYFPPALERLFESETATARARHLVLVGLLWMLLGTIYGLVSPSGHILVDGPFDAHQLVRLGIVLPVVALVTFAIWWGIPPFMRELLMMIACIVAPASIILVVTLVQDGDPGAIRGALTLILLFITVVVRLRFWFAAVACLTLIGVQVGAPAIVGNPMPAHIPLVLVTIGVSLLANYTLEREFRLNYLQRILGRIQRGRMTILVEQLHDLSQSDALTGLPNRRAMDSQLEELCATGEVFSVILVDVDAFKPFNDQYGHQEGDACLKRLGAILRASLRRTSDRVARMGGEEFAVVLPNTRLEDAHKMAERMRKAVLDLRIPHDGSPAGGIVSISAGVSEARPPTDPNKVLAEADKALYQAKEAGRNTIILSR